MNSARSCSRPAGNESPANEPAESPSSAGASPRSLSDHLAAAIHAHDRATSGSTALWLGAEPTFTDRTSEAPEWLSEALGPDKEARARRMLQRLAESQPGALVLRCVGRQYAGEPTPRWCYGLLVRRDGLPLWSGPPDRLQDGLGTPATRERAQALVNALVQVYREAACFAESISGPDSEPLRLVFRDDERPVCTDPSVDLRLARPSLHERPAEGWGPHDELAADGSYLLLAHGGGGRDENEVWLELPGFQSVATLTRFLERLRLASERCGLGSLGLRGFPPPIDDSVAFTTLTPDPAVLEINQAPEPDLQSFHRSSERLFALAAEFGLSPYRLQYNGAVSDSGGGGQLTFGGKTPATSPFFVTPELLPRLIRYLIRHPSLSYWFATQYVGGSSQSPRADEGMREALLELDVALEQLSLLDSVSPHTLWSTLRHFLADSSGNPHRSELNIEKLQNPHLPGRGMLGLVEFRALSMAPSLAVSTARAMLFRSIVSMLQGRDQTPTLVHWGNELHDRFALPFYLRHDLAEVFADLRASGLELGGALEELLLDREAGVLGGVELLGCRLCLEEAIEFWPLVGDVASQEGGGSRLVDASTSRIEVRLDAPVERARVLGALEISVSGHALPMRTVATPKGVTRILGLRYRNFVPVNGLHPLMGAEHAVSIEVSPPSGAGLRVTLHSWHPRGEAYPGLPRDREDARQRRHDRVVVEQLASDATRRVRQPPRAAVSDYCLDLRRLHRP